MDQAAALRFNVTRWQDVSPVSDVQMSDGPRLLFRAIALRGTSPAIPGGRTASAVAASPEASKL